MSPLWIHLDDIPDIHDHHNWSQGCLNSSSLYPFVPRILKSWHMRGLKYKKFIKATFSLRKTQKVHQDYCLLEEDTWWIFLTFLILVKVIQTTIYTLVGFLLNISGKLWSIAWDMPNFRSRVYIVLKALIIIHAPICLNLNYLLAYLATNKYFGIQLIFGIHSRQNAPPPSHI